MAFEGASVTLSQGTLVLPEHCFKFGDAYRATGDYFRSYFPLWAYVTIQRLARLQTAHGVERLVGLFALTFSRGIFSIARILSTFVYGQHPVYITLPLISKR